MDADTQKQQRSYQHPLLGVEVRHLATLSALSRTGSFRHAARELGYVQSSASQQIARLEQIVGTQLVERQRGQRSVRLTPAGEALKQRAERILGELQAARIDLAAPGRAGEHVIRLGIASDSTRLLPTLLSAVASELPDTVLQITEAVEDQALRQLLERGAVDVIVGVAFAAPGLALAVLDHDPFVLLVRRDSPIVAAGAVSSARELADERLIVPASVLSERPLHALGGLLDRAARVPVAASVARLVADGHGIGLVPMSMVTELPDSVMPIATAGLIAPRRLVLGWHAARRRTPRIRAFCDIATRTLADDDLSQRQHAA